jgi:hypothetical protein
MRAIPLHRHMEIPPVAPPDPGSRVDAVLVAVGSIRLQTAPGILNEPEPEGDDP